MDPVALKELTLHLFSVLVSAQISEHQEEFQKFFEKLLLNKSGLNEKVEFVAQLTCRVQSSLIQLDGFCISAASEVSGTALLAAEYLHYDPVKQSSAKRHRLSNSSPILLDVMLHRMYSKVDEDVFGRYIWEEMVDRAPLKVREFLQQTSWNMSSTTSDVQKLDPMVQHELGPLILERLQALGNWEEIDTVFGKIQSEAIFSSDDVDEAKVLHSMSSRSLPLDSADRQMSGSRFSDLLAAYMHSISASAFSSLLDVIEESQNQIISNLHVPWGLLPFYKRIAFLDHFGTSMMLQQHVSLFRDLSCGKFPSQLPRDRTVFFWKFGSPQGAPLVVWNRRSVVHSSLLQDAKDLLKRFPSDSFCGIVQDLQERRRDFLRTAASEARTAQNFAVAARFLEEAQDGLDIPSFISTGLAAEFSRNKLDLLAATASTNVETVVTGIRDSLSMIQSLLSSVEPTALASNDRFMELKLIPLDYLLLLLKLNVEDQAETLHEAFHCVAELVTSAFTSSQAELSSSLGKRCFELWVAVGRTPRYENVPIAMHACDLLCRSLSTAHCSPDVLSRVFQLCEMQSECRSVAVAALQKVPAFVFVPWVSAMLSSLPQESGYVHEEILNRVLSEFPQPLFYKFRSVLPIFRSTEASSSRMMFFCDRMEQRCQAETFAMPSKFLAEVVQFRSFRLCLDDIMKEIAVLDSASSAGAIRSSVFSLSTLLTKAVRMWPAFAKSEEECLKFVSDSLKLLCGGTNAVPILDVRMRILPGLKTKLTPLIQRSELHSSKKVPLRLFSELLDSVSTFTETDSSRLQVPIALNSDFPWRASTEIPFVYCCEPFVLVMPSVRQPIRFGMLSSDGVIHRYLVKTGEDLRLDERILGLFHMINRYVQTSHATSTSVFRGKLMSYGVIPLSTTCGLIEWVSDTTSLYSISRSNANVSHVQQEIFKLFVPSLQGGLPACVRGICESWNPQGYDSLVPAFSSIISKYRSSNLRGALQLLASSFETFFFVRSSFVQSLSLLNIVSYILGIGDRHMENFLLKTDTIDLVGIDFGLAFGAALENQAIAELVPFRLSPAMQDVSHPLNPRSVYVPFMSRYLSVLLDHRDALLSVLSIFVKEPVVVASSSLSSSSHYQDPVEAGQQMLATVQQKLDLHNPIDVLVDGLKQNSRIPRVSDWSGVHSFVAGRGFKQTAHRSRYAELERMSAVHDYVDCLVDMAVDPALLACMYIGWKAWW
eukprot:ANDGO_07183.mRNA.1 DNA-dependent protein kinase catalytic subunit